MKNVSSCFIRFYAELNDFLPPEKRQTTLKYTFWGQPAVKDIIESFGIPHTEIDLILVNGESTGFYYRVKAGDYISVYPVFESLDIAPIVKVRPSPLREIRFLLDAHLGKLATYLRLAGFDSLYSRSFSDSEIVDLAQKERCIILTRDRGLLMRSAVTHGYLIRNTDPRLQFQEVVHRFDLYRAIRPFSRCSRCNCLLQEVKKEEIYYLLPPKVRENCHEFRRCRSCNRIYWKGTHYQHILQNLLHLCER